ncbi:hypothetical protein sr15334 [Sporisorium reilianum SRZ2]|uniref:Uncharacterized protein n=1 Tax=Sporisorium reilianum (strain SRZ2) TaxID=999809 RepID=E6ZPV8_SPORE|nr:hypothetical protein sr15334 [Sporisorium reilianum SRZ2]
MIGSLSAEQYGIVAVLAALATITMAKDTTCKQKLSGETQKSVDDDAGASAEGRDLEADKAAWFDIPIAIDAEQSDVEEEREVDIDLSSIRTPSPPPATQARTPKLKHILRPKSEAEIESWKKHPWCKNTPTATYAEAVQAFYKDRYRARETRKELKQLGLPYNHITIPRLDDVLVSRGLEKMSGSSCIGKQRLGSAEQEREMDNDRAFAQAYRDTKIAQNQANSERRRLRSAGRSCDHVVSITLAEVLASRGIKDPRKASSQRTKTASGSSTQVDDRKTPRKASPALKSQAKGCASGGLSNPTDSLSSHMERPASASSSKDDPATLDPSISDEHGSYAVQDDDHDCNPSLFAHQAEDDPGGESDSDCSTTSTVSWAELRSSGLVDIRAGFERNRETLIRLSGVRPEALTQPSDVDTRGQKRKSPAVDPERLRKKRRKSHFDRTDHMPINDAVTTHDDTRFAPRTLRCNAHLPPTPTPSASQFARPSGVDSWPSTYFPSASPLPTPAPSQAAPSKRTILDDATLGSLSRRASQAHECIDRLRDDLARMGSVVPREQVERVEGCMVALRQLARWADGAAVQGAKRGARMRCNVILY